MNFNEFQICVIDLIRNKKGEDFIVKEKEVLKNNGVRLRGIIIWKKHSSICPVIYLEEAFRKYKEGSPLEQIVEEIISLYEEKAQFGLGVDFFGGFSQIKEGIFCEHINYKKNRERLKDTLYLKYMSVLLPIIMRQDGRNLWD